jgi:hypothetical protein
VASKKQIDEDKFQKQSVDMRMNGLENSVVAVDVTSTSSVFSYAYRRKRKGSKGRCRLAAGRDPWIKRKFNRADSSLASGDAEQSSLVELSKRTELLFVDHPDLRLVWVAAQRVSSDAKMLVFPLLLTLTTGEIIRGNGPSRVSQCYCHQQGHEAVRCRCGSFCPTASRSSFPLPHKHPFLFLTNLSSRF